MRRRAHPNLSVAALVLTSALAVGQGNARGRSTSEILVGFGRDGRSYVVIERTLVDTLGSPSSRPAPPRPSRPGPARIGSISPDACPPSTHRLLLKGLDPAAGRVLCPRPATPHEVCPGTTREALRHPAVAPLRLVAPPRARRSYRSELVTTSGSGVVVIVDGARRRRLGTFQVPHYLQVTSTSRQPDVVLGPEGRLALVEATFYASGGLGKGSGGFLHRFLAFSLPSGGVAALPVPVGFRRP